MGTHASIRILFETIPSELFDETLAFGSNPPLSDWRSHRAAPTLPASERRTTFYKRVRCCRNNRRRCLNLHPLLWHAQILAQVGGRYERSRRGALTQTFRAAARR